LKKAQDAGTNAESIIGQFGVGFYSSFIVSDIVEVFTKQEGKPGVRWVSDGSGKFEVDDVANLGFERGTKIVCKLKPECRQFSKELEVEKILKKYSLFITYPIKLNGNVINSLQAIWYRDKRDVTEDEYERFFEHVAQSKIPYKWKLHYSTDVPLAIKAIFYIPSTHQERMGMQQEDLQMNLYCRKVLIKENCRELLPGYLRFVKGVVDCEDLPLNISRETYQDSSLIAKLRNVMTRRVLKMLEDEQKRDPEKYAKWFDEFSNFFKEGLTTDSENKEALLKLMRYNCTFQEASCSLEDYVKHMKQGQNKIYFLVSQDKNAALTNPFMEPFKDTDVPVLILSNNVDELCFQQTGDFKGHKFVNIETSYEEIQKDLGKKEADNTGKEGVPEDDITNFSLWLKHELQPYVGKVTISKRLQGSPAIIFG